MHLLRVQARRLCSALSTYPPVLPEGPTDELRGRATTGRIDAEHALASARRLRLLDALETFAATADVVDDLPGHRSVHPADERTCADSAVDTAPTNEHRQARA